MRGCDTGSAHWECCFAHVRTWGIHLYVSKGVQECISREIFKDKAQAARWEYFAFPI